MTDRDQFAAAALAGLLARNHAVCDRDHCFAAYQWADAMLRERERTNHDAAPAARASVGRPRTDKADLPTRCGTGDTPVTEPLPVFASGSGSVTPVSYEKNDEKRVFYDTKSPRNGALSGCETVPDPDSRVWETPCTPQPHATPQRGSVQGEGSFRDSRFAKEPVAWAVRYKHGDTGIVELLRTLEECRHRWANRTTDYWQYEPLYRSPQPTLTDEEREAVECCVESYQDSAFKTRRDIAATLRGLLERLGGER